MKNHLLKTKQAQFLLIGILFTSLGFIFYPNQTISRVFFYIAILFLGFFATKNALVETIQSKSPNVDLLMILAAIGAVMINFESEGAVLLLIFAGAEVLEEFASDKSTRAISELMSQVPSTAHLLKENGEVVEVLTETLKPKDTIVVSKGSQIPIDGFADRQTLVNESALTGEAVPVIKERHTEVYAGTLNKGNVFNLEVNKRSDETVFSNIIRMVEEAQNRPSKISRFIDRIESKYVIGVLVAVPTFIFINYYFSALTFQEAFYRGMVLLTVSSPCALVASATPATLSAISNGAKNGILFKGGAAMEALSTMDTLYTDKTGTLTVGEFRVVDYKLGDSVLKEVVYMEQQSSHPIAEAIVSVFKEVHLDGINQEELVEEIAGSGVTKGNIRIGKPSDFVKYSNYVDYKKKVKEGYTTIFVGEKQYVVGYFTLADQVRSEAVQAITNFKNEGINIHLLTGDNKESADKVAKAVNIKHYVAGCLPEDKINCIHDSQAKGEVVGMIGDGINDAPALANANIGIAMGSGSAVAMESSDVVIVKNDLNKLFDSYKLSQKLNRIIIQNVVFSLAVIIILIGLNLMGLLDLPMGVVFHEGSTILVIINGLRLLRYKSDKKAKRKLIPLKDTI